MFYKIGGSRNQPLSQDEENKLEISKVAQEIDTPTIRRIKKVTAAPKSRLEPEYLDNPNGLFPMSIDENDNYYGVVGYQGDTIFMSSDLNNVFQTRTEGPDFSNLGNGGRPIRVQKTSAGYVVITGTEIFFSSTFTSGYTSVLDISAGGKGFNRICINYYNGGVGREVFLVGEYTQVLNTPHDLYISTNSGQNWTKVRSTTVVDQSVNSHWHHAIYDPYGGRIIAVNGDGLNGKIHQSYDLGATWSTPTTEDEKHYQPTMLYPFPDRIAMCPDSVVKMAQFNYLKNESGLTEGYDLKLERGLEINSEIPASLGFAAEPMARLNSNEAYIQHPATNSQTGIPSYIVGTGDGGVTWHLLFNINLLNLPNRFRDGLVGVDSNGFFCGFLRYGGSDYLLKFKSIDWLYQ